MNAVFSETQAEGRSVPLNALCRLLEVPRSSVYYQSKPTKRREGVDPALEVPVRDLIQSFPTFGIRRVWAYLRNRMGIRANRKKVERLMQIRGWTMKRRRVGRRPRVEFQKSVAERPNERWSTDVALVFCGEADGWCSFVPVLDCCTREALGWELSHTARAKTAERALEGALIGRFGWLHGAPEGMVLRHDNGLVFGSRLYRNTAKEYGLRQEYITPYTPEENGLVERFIRSFKEECVWLHSFDSIEHAKEVIGKWINWYNTDRPHQALGYRTPVEYRTSFEKLSA